MSKLNIESIANAVESIIEEKLQPIITTLEEHTALLNNNSATLDRLVTNKQVKIDEKTIQAFRFDRLEKWAKKAGTKIGIKLQL